MRFYGNNIFRLSYRKKCVPAWYVYKRLFSYEIKPSGIKNKKYDPSDVYFRCRKVHLVFFFNWARVRCDQEDFIFFFLYSYYDKDYNIL